MGQEIQHARFESVDFETFLERLRHESELLTHWFNNNFFKTTTQVGGFELEAWLVDKHGHPMPINASFVEQCNTPLVTYELAKFNVELNGKPQLLKGKALSKIHNELQDTWNRCTRTAEQLGAQLVMIGILPTLTERDLTVANMSNLKRYQALNEQVIRLRNGKPLKLNIVGHEHLRLNQKNVMLESATTSFQIHFQVPAERAARYYNASQILSGPMIALSANSPYLFGKDLWAETRIPLFEQSVEVGGFDGAQYGPLRRVTFGGNYMQRSILECFIENLEHYPILLPMVFESSPDEMQHVMLHNGTIWRWNRPLIGFNNNKPHLRIEHRVVPGGPSVIDEIANLAFYYGTTHYLATLDEAPEERLPFSHTRDNFYHAAKNGLSTQFMWYDNLKCNAKNLILDTLLPMANAGLENLGIDSEDINTYLKIIESRLNKSTNGSVWQRAFVAKYGHNMAELTKVYVEHQQSGNPVHEWDV